MQIHKLEYYDNNYPWTLAAVDFLPNLNLLVGVSGVGKTRILKAIRSLKAIANGASFNGIGWNVCFTADNGIQYNWSGEFETRESAIRINESVQEESVKLIYEKLTGSSTDILIEKNTSGIFFKGSPTPKLSPFESLIDLLSQEDEISPVKASFNKIIESECNSTETTWSLPISIFKKFEKLPFSRLKESDLPILVKLSILYTAIPKEFKKIKEAFMQVFPNVIDIKFELIKDDEIPIQLSDLLKDATTLSIRENGVESWIKDISSGMIKTLIYIGEIYLSAENSVILIDEFENSLGVNCLNSVTELVLSGENLQFVMTSHHPYIINNFSPVFWRIVTRSASLVTVKSAKDFHISNSRQKAFIDLINILEEDEDLEN